MLLPTAEKKLINGRNVLKMHSKRKKTTNYNGGKSSKCMTLYKILLTTYTFTIHYVLLTLI